MKCRRRDSFARAVEALECRRLLSLAVAGTPFLVNGYTTSVQADPAVATDADGDSVVVWKSLLQEGAGSSYGIYARRLNAAGAAQGADIHVNTFTVGAQYEPSVAMDADGDFVVAWSSDNQDGSVVGVYAQRFNAAGAAQGGEFRVNSAVTNAQQQPTIAMDADGDFVVAWFSASQPGENNTGIFAQRFNALGLPQGAEFHVNTYTLNNQLDPTIAMSANGNFVIAWDSFAEDSSNYGIYAQRYSAAGVPQGGELQVSTTYIGIQALPSAGMDVAGNFVVAWQSSSQDGSDYGVYAQRFTAAGAKKGSEFRVNTFTGNAQQNPSIRMDSSGNFTAAWESFGQAGAGTGTSIYAKRYNALGQELAAPSGAVLGFGNEYRVSTTSNATTPAVALDAKGDALIAFAGSITGDSSGVIAQRYLESTDVSPPTIAGVFVNGERVVNYAVVSPPMTQIVISFSEDLSVVGGASGAHSATNPANWLLIQNGADISASIASINYAFNASTNRFEATINLSSAYTSGNFQLRASDALQDVAGNALDGDRDGAAGGSASASFSIATQSASAEYRANSTTAGNQQAASVAIDAAGDSVVAWQSDGQDGSGFGIFAQRFSPAGAPLGAELAVNVFTTGAQTHPDVATDDAGNFVIIWQSAAQDGAGYGVYARRYSAAGAPLGGEFRVNTFTTLDQRSPVITMGGAGNFVIAWEGATISADGSGYNIYAQRYDAAGTPQGGETRMNAITASDQLAPAIAADAAGDFIVAWQTPDAVNGGTQVDARAFTSAATPGSGEITVNTSAGASSADVAADAHGNFVVTWNHTDGSSTGVFAQRFNSSAAPLGAEFRVNTFTTDEQENSAVGMDAAGNFLVSWTTAHEDASETAVFARRFAADGSPLSDAFLVNTYTADRQSDPAVALNATGAAIIAWQSNAQDGSVYGIYAKRYSVRTPNVATLTDAPDPVLVGSNITLSASNVIDDGAIASVGFYRESNGVAGLQVGAAGDTLVGSTSAAAAGVYTVTISSAALPATRYTYYAQATDDQGLAGAPAITVNRVIDGSEPPVVIASSLYYNTLPLTLSFTFDQDVSASLDDSDITVVTNPGGVPFDATLDSFNLTTNTAVFTLNGELKLPDGNYRATLLAPGILGPAGTPVAANYVFDFFALGGDANHDRIVDVADLGVFATNWQSSGKTFSQGDFNYDGRVDVADLGIIATNWQKSLPAPAPTAPLHASALANQTSGAGLLPPGARPTLLFSTAAMPRKHLADDLF